MPVQVLLCLYDKLLKAKVTGKDSAFASPTVSLAEKSLERTKNAEIVAATLKAKEPVIIIVFPVIYEATQLYTILN